MSENGHFEIPKEMRSMAEASFDQARAAFEKFVTSAQQTAGSLEERGASVRAGAKDIDRCWEAIRGAARTLRSRPRKSARPLSRHLSRPATPK